MLSDLSAQLGKWPVPLLAGALFLVLWIPIVLVAAAIVGLQIRAGRNRVIGDLSDWKRAVFFLLVLGLPLAIGFGLLFALSDLFGGEIVLSVAFAVVCILLIGFMLPRLSRW